jgi:putative ATP-binding cassette transporter
MSNVPQERTVSTVARRYLGFVTGFWRGDRAIKAWLLTGLVLLLVLLQIGAQVALNWWNRYFFDGLEAKNVSSIWQAVALLPAVVAFSALVMSAFFAFRMLLQVKWRA